MCMYSYKREDLPDKEESVNEKENEELMKKRDTLSISYGDSLGQLSVISMFFYPLSCFPFSVLFSSFPSIPLSFTCYFSFAFRLFFDFRLSAFSLFDFFALFRFLASFLVLSSSPSLLSSLPLSLLHTLRGARGTRPGAERERSDCDDPWFWLRQIPPCHSSSHHYWRIRLYWKR